MDQKLHITGFKNLTNPLWLLIVITIPHLIFTAIMSRVFYLASPILSEKGITSWIITGSIFFVLLTAFTIYALVSKIRKMETHFVIPLLILASYIGFLYYLGMNYENLFPSSIPTYVIREEEIFIYIGTFLVPCLFFSILVFVELLGRRMKKDRLIPNILLTLAIPVGWYFFYTQLLHHTGHYSKIGTHAVISLFIVITVCFYFLLIRLFFILFKKGNFLLKKFEIVWKILFALVFPVTGLLLNEMYFPFSILKSTFHIDNFHVIFGNLSNPLFIAVAVINGILIIIPSVGHKIFRISLFAARSVFFIFSFYMFIIFLPFYPLFIFAIIIFGAGFLIISPLILFLLNIRVLISDFKYVSGLFRIHTALTIMAASFMIIPCIIITGFLIEKNNLMKALEYVYQSNLSDQKTPDINLPMLKKTFASLHSNKRNRFFTNDRTKILSPLYETVVFDNLTLSDQKMKTLKGIFFDEHPPGNPPLSDTPAGVRIKNMDTKSLYDGSTGLYRTTIDLDLENGSIWNNEFLTYIKLPEGVWIDDYYLYVGNKKTKGILTEKKATLWLYQEIKKVRKDPGILYYTGHNTVTLRVFPFLKNETRTSGFTLVHIEPLITSHNGNDIILSTVNSLDSPIYSDDKMYTYIPSNTISHLPSVRLKPCYYFIVDCSEQSMHYGEILKNAIDDFMRKKNISVDNVKVIMNDFKTEIVSYNEFIKKSMEDFGNKGGFYLDRALKQICYDNAVIDNRYPIPVIVSLHPENAIIEDNAAEYLSVFLSSEKVFLLNKNRLYSMNATDLSNGNLDRAEEIGDFPEMNFVKLTEGGRTSYMLNDGKAKIVMYPENIKDKFDTEKNASGLLSLTGFYRYNLLHPEETDKSWKKMFYGSIDMNVLSPVTCFTVLENEMQYRVLFEKQKEIINNKKFLDKGDEAQEMPEPSIMLLLIPVVIIAVMYYRKKKQTSHKNIN